MLIQYKSRFCSMSQSVLFNIAIVKSSCTLAFPTKLFTALINCSPICLLSMSLILESSFFKTSSPKKYPISLRASVTPSEYAIRRSLGENSKLVSLNSGLASIPRAGEPFSNLVIEFS